MELSASPILLWPVCHNKGTIGFSALLRKYVASLAASFLVVVRADVHPGIVLRYSPPLPMTKYGCCRVNGFLPRGYTTDSRGDNPLRRYWMGPLSSSGFNVKMRRTQVGVIPIGIRLAAEQTITLDRTTGVPRVVSA
jgi:hypothetical protein